MGRPTDVTAHPTARTANPANHPGQGTIDAMPSGIFGTESRSANNEHPGHKLDPELVF
jgi:hypothetical protein